MQSSAVRTALNLVLALMLVSVPASTAPAQQGQSIQAVPSAPTVQPLYPYGLLDSLKPRSYFPHPFAPFNPQRIAPANLANTPRLDRLLRDGKLYLSINDAVALALENNLDLAIARIELNIADTDIWRANSGSAISGVDSGVVQNTPGGGVGALGGLVGSGAGGTSVGAGGAGAGAGGIVGSTLGSGPSVASFDPVLSGVVQLDHLTSQCNTPYCATHQNTLSANFLYSQSFHWGSDMTVSFNNSRVTSNSVYNYLTPALNSSFQLRLTQHLLQGFGLATNTRYIKIAKNNRKISDVAFQNQIVVTVGQIENMYWDLLYAYENVQVQQKQMEFARKTLLNDQKQKEIGSLAAIEVVKAQSTVASFEQTLTLALTNLELAQLLMKNAISRTLVDPSLIDAEVVPTSTIVLPEQEVVAPTSDLVDEAMSRRPELAEARIYLANTQISNKAIRSSLLPTLDVSAYYGGSGLGGNRNPAFICVDSPEVCGFNVAPPTVSYGGTLNQLIDSSAPDKGMTVNLNIPIRNGVAQATQVRSEFESQQAQYRVQQLENQIRIEVRNAQFGVQQNRASVDAAQAAVDFAQQSLDSERTKFEIRAATSVMVLQSQAALTQAEALLISAKVAYEKAVVELDRAVGLLLEHAGILMPDAQSGQVTQTPHVPNATPKQDNPAPKNPAAPAPQ